MADGGARFGASHFPTRAEGQRIAVIGAGAAGLSAAWLLSQRHQVTLFEKEARAGGHANTVTIQEAQRSVAIDTGFIVFNEKNYPNFTAWLAALGAPSAPSDMSFAVSLKGGAEYSSVDAHGFINGGLNLFRPRFWSMLRDLLRFYRRAPHESPSQEELSLTLGEFLDLKGYGRSFQDEHLLPQAAAIWSATLDDIRNYPACAFIRFFDNHGLLKLKGRPKWRTVEGGSASYVSRALENHEDVRLGAGVSHIARLAEGVVVTDAHGESALFDQVVIAAHAKEARAMLSDASDDEHNLLGAFSYSLNKAVLHTDARLMPRNKRLWASWNYVGADQTRAPCGVTYWMNRLQNLPTTQDYFLSLNPSADIDERTIAWRGDYEHPIFDTAALTAQRALWRLQGVNRTWFCGAHFGSGFHEDAVQAGLAVAEQLGGVLRPWIVPGQSDRIFISSPSPATAEAA